MSFKTHPRQTERLRVVLPDGRQICATFDVDFDRDDEDGHLLTFVDTDSITTDQPLEAEDNEWLANYLSEIIR